MKNINKTKKIFSIVYALGILAILALGVIAIPLKVSADIAGFVTPYNSTGFSNNVQSNNQYNTYQAQSNYTPAVYSTPSTSNSGSQANSNTSTKAVEKTSTESTKEVDESSNLAANAIFGSNGFTPSGLVQWILFAILILLVVILVRKIYGAGKKYYLTPLKHE